MALGRRLEASTASKDAPTSPTGDETVRLVQDGLAKESTINSLSVTPASSASSVTLSATFYGRGGEFTADGVTNNSSAFQTAATARQTIYLPAGTILCTSQMALSLSRDTTFVGHPDGTIIKFALTGHTDSCMLVTLSTLASYESGSPYPYIAWRDIEFDFDLTGLDGYEQNKGSPAFVDCVFKNSYRDLFYFNLNGTGYWIENTAFCRCLYLDIGRHLINAYLKNGNGVTPFWNETTFDQCELRGLGRRYAGTENSGVGCNFIRMTFDGTLTGSKVDTVFVNGCNFDAQKGQSLSANAIGHLMEAVMLNSGVGTIDNIDIRSGGIESTDASVSSARVLVADAALTVQRIKSDFVNYQWAAGYPSDTILNLDSVEAVNSTSGKFYQTALKKPNGIAVKAEEVIRLFNTDTTHTDGQVLNKVESYGADTEGAGVAADVAFVADGTTGQQAIELRAGSSGAATKALKIRADLDAEFSGNAEGLGTKIVSGFLNSPVYYQADHTAVASSTVNVDIPIAAMTGYSTPMPIIVTVYKGGFFNALTHDQFGVYLVKLARENAGPTSYVSATLLFSSSGNVSYGFDPATAVAVSLPTSTSLRVAVTFGANVGSGGSATRFYVQASRGFLPFYSGGNGTTENPSMSI